LLMKLVGVQFVKEVRIFGVPRSSIGSNTDGIVMDWDGKAGMLYVTRTSDGAETWVPYPTIAGLSWRKDENDE